MTRILEWIVSSAALLAVLIALRQILKGKISLRLQYALWGLALIRLLVPVSFGSTSMSVANALPEETRSLYARAVSSDPYGLGTAIMRDTIYLGREATIKAGTESSTYQLPRQQDAYEAHWKELKQKGETFSVGFDYHELQGWKEILLGLWIAGMAAMALCLLGSNLRFALRLRKTRKLQREETLPVYLTAETDTPCLFGLFRPAVYVTPEAAEEEGRLRHVIEHELTHYRHGDHLWSLLRGICLILHWYNPLVWWAAILSRRDCELACDEATIRRLGEGERTAYGRTLIYMTCLKRSAILVTATTMTGCKGSIRERIALIVKKPKTAVITLVIVLLAAAVAVGCTFTGGKEPGTPKPTEPPATAAPSPEPTAAPVPTSAVPTDDWFIETALPHAQVFAAAVGRMLRTEGAVVFRYADGVSADVVFPCDHGKRFGVSVSFAKGEDGQWNVLPEGAVNLITRDRGTAYVYLDIGDQEVPDAVADYAIDIAKKELEYLEQDCGYVFDDARITAITYIDTGTVGLWEGYNLYRLEWRFHPAEGEEIMLVGGMTMEDGYLTEWGSAGQPYILIGWNGSNGVDSWERICVTNTDVIETEYGTPEMIEKYGNAYTAAAVELRAKAREQQSLLDPRGLSVASPASDPAMIGQDWAKAYAARFTQAPEDDPYYCRSMELRRCEVYAESLLNEPKQYVYVMGFACDPADANSFHSQLAGWGQDTENPDWLRFDWFVVLEDDLKGGWECAQAGTGGYGGWGYLNYGWEADELLDRLVTEQVGGEDVLMLLPLIDWGEFDRLPSDTWDASFNALWAKCEEACLTEGRYWDPERTVLYSDIYFYDQIIRDLYVILGFLHADGAYAEGLAYLMAKQYDYDPLSFEQCLTQYLDLTEEQERVIRLSMQNERGGGIPYDARLNFYDAAGKHVSDDGGWYELSRIASIGVAWSGDAPLGVRLLTTPTGTGTYEQTQILAQRSLSQEETEGKEIRFTLSELNASPVMGHLWVELDYGRELHASPYYQVYREVDSITLNLTDFTLMRIGESYTLRATVTPAGTGLKVNWTSDDPEVATVDENGTVTAVGHGTAVIRASVGGAAAECIVRVPAVSTRTEKVDPAEEEPLTVTLLFYEKPTREKTTPDIARTITISGDRPGGTDLINEIKSFVDKFRFWNDDYLADRVQFYFDGDITFSDRESVYYFSYEQRELYYDHYFVQITSKDVEYLKSLG